MVMPLLDETLLKELDELGGFTPLRYEKVKRLPTGSLILDRKLRGGWPRGHYSIIGGKEGSGKSTLLLLTAIKAKVDGNTVAIVDGEHKFPIDLAFDSGLGEPGKDYVLHQPVTAEDGFESARKFVERGFDVVAIDSLVSMPPRAELEGTLDDTQMALRARIISKFFTMTSGLVRQSDCAVIIINQIRDNLKPANPYSPKFIRPGGKAKDHFPSVCIDLNSPEKDYESEEDKKKKVNVIRIINGRIWKNIGEESEFEVKIRFIDNVLRINTGSEIMQLGKEFGIFTKKDGTPIAGDTAVFYFNGDELGKGRAEAMNAIMQDIDLRNEIIELIRQEITK